jgi:transcriptional regulator with XRE-family HTH domain
VSDDLDAFISKSVKDDPEFERAWKVTQLAARIGSQVNAIRSRRGLTIADLAIRSGFGEAFLLEFEQGLDTDVTIETIYKIADALGATAEILLKELPTSST